MRYNHKYKQKREKKLFKQRKQLYDVVQDKSKG